MTVPNGEQPPPGANVFGRGEGGHGNGELWTNVWMWGEGEVLVPASHVGANGSFGMMKWSWYRHVPGTLAIEGRRLDAPARPLRADIPDGYGERGFQVSGLAFPSAGCWEITGRVGGASLRFVTRVVAPWGAGGAAATPVPLAGGATCWVTGPNGQQPPAGKEFSGQAPGGYGNGVLWTDVWMWGEGRVPVPASHVLADGSLGPMTWVWWRGVSGRLEISGRRLDAPAPPLRVETAGGVRLDLPAPTPRLGNRIAFSPTGFHPVGLIFPTDGCWEITARVGDADAADAASLTFATLVIPPPSSEPT